MAKFVSKFTGQEIDTKLEAVSGKHGASYFDPATNTMLYFASKEDLSDWLATSDSSLIIDEAVMNFTGTMYQVKVQSEMPSKNLYFTTQADKAEITVSFLSQKKGITDVSWQDIVEDYNVSVYVDKGGLGTFVPLIVDQFVVSGNTFTFDVKKALATGANRVRVVAVGSESADKAQGSEMFIVNLTSMYLAPSNFTWYKPFIEGETYALGGMNIGGNLNKTVKVKMSKEGYERLYEVNIGSNIYTTTAYVFNGLEFPSGGTGVYNVDIWLDANGLESDHLSYNIICVSQADKFTAQLVAIGDPAKTVYNFSDNKLFEYCVYNGGTATATPHIKVSYVVNTNPTTIIDEDLVDVATASPLTYTASLEIEMEDESAALQLETLMTYGNEQVFMFPVDNSKSYPATTGAVFYMNPSARNNAQSNREKVINSISGAEIDAVFTRMAWTDGTDGWTIDDEGRKCLRLPAGCTMDMAYQPMASVSQKTIELVYKVKNAADYDEPIFSIGDIYKDVVVNDYNISLNSGYFYQGSGEILSSASFSYSSPIKLLVGETVVFRVRAYGYTALRECKEDGTYIENVIIFPDGKPAQTGQEIRYTAERDMWVQICSPNDMLETYPPFVEKKTEGFNPNFRGIVIRPKNILIHSRDLNVNDSLQDYNTTDEETLHVLITIIPNYKTNYGNLAQIYVNGDKVRSFSFETADRWDVAANMKFGSETADTLWYKARVYDRGFESYDALKNYINSLPSTKAKEEAKAKIEAPLDDSYKVTYDECVKNGLNTMVVEIIGQDQTVPSIANPSAKTCNTWIKINNPIDGELDADFARLFSGEIIEGETIEGQGTTAMTYARWNFRWKLSSKYNKRRITAKKNFASSMHSHKMGATRLFNDLNRAIVGPNDADSRVAVYQYPVYGFQKILVEGTTDQYLYEFIGLYTIGPDKGDKATFGFDGEYESTLIHLEGTDHTPKGVGFDYPYGELGYSGSAEALGAVNATGAVVAAWECGAAGDYDPKDDPTEVKAMLDAEFRPAYDVAELNSTYILGVTETLAEMNANISAWQAKKDAEGRSYADLQFFTDGVYDLYFYNTRTQKYEARGINMLTDLGVSVDGLSLDEKTELFKAERRRRFVESWETYWHKNDAIFHYAFVLLFGATDNFKKNTYPYKYRPIAEGGVYRWRQDDLDTLFDINNQGLAAKIYSILVGDKTETGSGSIYRGDTSAFWTLIKECFPTEIKAMVHAILDKMVELSPYGNNTLEKLVGCVRYYFWDKAQAYFPASAYSKDAEWTYEDTWAAGLYKEVNPLQQSLGGHKEAEIDWVTMRMLFCAMYFNYGPFGAVNDSFSDTSTGQIAYGGAGAKTYVITMACDGNPTILRGQSELVTFGDRVKAGETIELTVPDSSGADTRIYIQGVDWMEDIGDLSDLQVSADNPQLSVTSKRLQSVKIGDEDASKVTTNVEALNFGACPSMMIVDARNAKSLTGTIDLSKMPRLMEAYFGGTGVKAVNVPNGSKIAVLELGEETTQISLMNLKFMELEGFRYSELPKLEFLRIENCSHLNPFTMLKEIYNTEGNVIRDIRIIGFDVDGDASDVTMIANLANDVDKDGNPHIYNGIDAEGKPMDNSHPIIEGRLRVNGNIYEEDYEALKAVFSNLAMEFLGFYVSFKDPEVLRVLLEKITTDDGVGLTTEDIEGVTSIGTWFKGNTTIENFDEFNKFINVKSLSSTSQYNQGAFQGCTSLFSINLENIEVIGRSTFYGCANLEMELNLRNLKTLGNAAFQNTAITKILNLGEITTIYGNDYNNITFGGCTKLTEVHFPPSLISIGNSAFKGLTSLESVEFNEELQSIGTQAFQDCTSLESDEWNLPNLTTLGQNAFSGAKIKKLNLGALTTLPAATSSTQNFGDKSVLEEIVLSESLTTIPSYSFQGYTALAKVTIPEDNAITAIGNDAFRGTTAMDVDIVFPSLTEIGQRAFDASGIRSLSCPELLTIATQRDARGTFQACINLKHIDMPKVTYIGGRAFQGCSSLGEGEDLSLPMLSSEVGMAAFRYTLYERVVDLGSITSTQSAANLGEGAFANMPNLKFIKFPSTVTSLGRNTCYGCTALETVVCEAVTPPSFNAVFDSTNSTFIIYVPDESVEAYKAASGWSTYASRIYPMTDLEWALIGNVLTFEDPAVEAIALANWDTDGDGVLSKDEVKAVTSIGDLFKRNAEIKTFNEFKYFTNVTSIANYAFEYCSALNTINLSNIITIGNYAFQSCAALEGDMILPNLTSLGGSAFTKTGISSFVAPKIKTINSSTFARCPSLALVDFTDVTSIGTYAFEYCSALKTFICRNVTPPTLANTNALTGTSCTIYVPDEAVDTYKAATNWSTYASRIKPLSEYTE